MSGRELTIILQLSELRRWVIISVLPMMVGSGVSFGPSGRPSLPYFPGPDALFAARLKDSGRGRRSAHCIARNP